MYKSVGMCTGKNILRSDEANMNFATWTRMLVREMMDSASTGQQPLTTGSLVTKASVTHTTKSRDFIRQALLSDKVCDICDIEIGHLFSQLAQQRMTLNGRFTSFALPTIFAVAELFVCN